MKWVDKKNIMSLGQFYSSVVILIKNLILLNIYIYSKTANDNLTENQN